MDFVNLENTKPGAEIHLETKAVFIDSLVPSGIFYCYCLRPRVIFDKSLTWQGSAEGPRSVLG